MIFRPLDDFYADILDYVCICVYIYLYFVNIRDIESKSHYLPCLTYYVLFVFVFESYLSGITPGWLLGPYSMQWIEPQSTFAYKANVLYAVVSLQCPYLYKIWSYKTEQ